MAKRRVWDLRSMTEEQLRAAIIEAEGRERSARYNKGRRSWKRLHESARAELERRSRS